MLKKSISEKIMSNANHLIILFIQIIYYTVSRYITRIYDANQTYYFLLPINTSGTSVNKKKWHHLHHYHPRPKETKQILSQRNG